MNLLNQLLYSDRRNVLRLCNMLLKLRSSHLKSSYSTLVIKNSNEIKSFDKIPGPFRIPIWGNIHLYKLGVFSILDYHNVLVRLFEMYGPVVRQDIGNRTIIHLFDPDDVRTAINAEGKMPVVPPLQETTQLYRQKRKLSLGLGNTNHEEWYKLRKAIQQMMLRPKEVYHYLPLVDQVARDFVNKIESSMNKENQIPNLKNLISKWSLESSGMICFEKRIGCFDANEELANKLIQANTEIFLTGGILKFSLPIYKYFMTPKWKRFLEAEDFFFSVAQGLVNETILEIKELKQKGELSENQFNFLSYLLSRDELTEKDVTIITLSLFGDGLSTTAPSLNYNLYCLAKNQEVQEKLFEEIDKHTNPSETISINMINNLNLLKASVKEAFRLYPIGTEVSRVIQTDLIFGNYSVPAGTHVDFNQYVQFKNPKYFANPLSFRPDRWMRSDESSSLSTHPYLLIPFGHGTRMCAGRRFAEQDLYTVLTRILQKFRLELINPDEDIGQIYYTLLYPKRQLNIKFIKR